MDGYGGLDERYYTESEWRHHLRTTHDWKVMTEGLTGRQKKKFLKHKRDSFFNDIRNASVRAQADTASHTPSGAQTNDSFGTGIQGSNEAMVEFPHDHMIAHQQEGPQAQRAKPKGELLEKAEHEIPTLVTVEKGGMSGMPNLIEEHLGASGKLPWRGLSQERCEAPVPAKTQRNHKQEAKHDDSQRREENLRECSAGIARKRDWRKVKRFLFEMRNEPVRVNTKSAKKRKRIARKAAQREQIQRSKSHQIISGR
jgi:hypothetical protein